MRDEDRPWWQRSKTWIIGTLVVVALGIVSRTAPQDSGPTAATSQSATSTSIPVIETPMRPTSTAMPTAPRAQSTPTPSSAQIRQSSFKALVGQITWVEKPCTAATDRARKPAQTAVGLLASVTQKKGDVMALANSDSRVTRANDLAGAVWTACTATKEAMSMLSVPPSLTGLSLEQAIKDEESVMDATANLWAAFAQYFQNPVDQSVFAGADKLTASMKSYGQAEGRILARVGNVLHVEPNQVHPAPPPTPTPEPDLIQSVDVLPDPVQDNAEATITANVLPSARCAVRVVYADGYRATSESLRDILTAGDDGMLSWTWTPDTLAPGPATVAVHCILGTYDITLSKHFDVQQ